MPNKDERIAITKGNRRIMALTNAPSTATRLAAGRHAIAAPTGDKTWQLASPKRGEDIEVVVDTNSTKVVTLQTNSSAQTFFASTSDRLALTTGQGAVIVTFYGVSTSQFAVGLQSRSTAAVGTFSGSTR